MKFLQQLLEENRILTVLSDNLPNEIKESMLYEHVATYLEEYTAFNNIDAEQAIGMYFKYIRAYIKHCNHFVKTGQYPLALGINDFLVTREEYDVVMMLLILLTQHRYRIMQLLVTKTVPAEKALYIGLGSGIEVKLTQEISKEIHGYDLSINSFLYSKFPNAKLNIELYEGQFTDYFDVVYMIELLEHVSEPYTLLQTCYNSLKKGGKIYCTTATDVPQFDHLYNFEVAHNDFEEKLKAIGFSILYKEMIPHLYLSMELQPCNHFYILEKI